MGTLRSCCSCTNSTLRTRFRNPHDYNIVDASDASYFYNKLSYLVRSKRYPTLRERANVDTIYDIPYSFHYACTKYMLTHRLMGLRESLILKGDE